MSETEDFSLASRESRGKRPGGWERAGALKGTFMFLLLRWGLGCLGNGKGASLESSVNVPFHSSFYS